MNYRHLYHAGNFADVVKHVTQIALLNHFKEKETPFCYLDTHAGIGLYSLLSEATQKKQEYENGIGKLFKKNKNEMPAEIQQYISLVEKINNFGELLLYPGSPLIAAKTCRAQDRLVLCELHKADYQTLKSHFKYDKRIAIHHQDAYLAMKAFLPPKENRGIVLIDPPFEVTDEFDRIKNTLAGTLKHWRSGCYMVWYPVKEKSVVKRFLHDVTAFSKELCAFHFSIDPIIAKTALLSCGILIINPPWTLQETLVKGTLPYLKDQLQGQWEFVLG